MEAVPFRSAPLCGASAPSVNPALDILQQEMSCSLCKYTFWDSALTTLIGRYASFYDPFWCLCTKRVSNEWALKVITGLTNQGLKIYYEGDLNNCGLSPPNLLYIGTELRRKKPGARLAKCGQLRQFATRNFVHVTRGISIRIRLVKVIDDKILLM